MRVHASAKKLLSECKAGVEEAQPLLLTIEPVYGCRNQCRQCSLGDLPVELKFLEPKKLRDSLSVLNEHGVMPGRVLFTGRGETLSHPRFDELVAEVKKAYPKLQVHVNWEPQRVEDVAAFVRKTRGLTSLSVSLDGSHYEGLLRRLKREGKLTKEALKERGLDSKAEAVLNDVKHGLLCASLACAQNGSILAANLVGAEKEQDFFAGFARNALDKAWRDAGVNEGFPIEFRRNERLPRGSELGVKKEGVVRITHKGLITRAETD